MLVKKNEQKKGQSAGMSMLESAVSVIMGYLLTVMVQIYLFPLFGVKITLSDSLILSLIIVLFAFFKNFMVRRIFNRI